MAIPKSKAGPHTNGQPDSTAVKPAQPRDYVEKVLKSARRLYDLGYWIVPIRAKGEKTKDKAGKDKVCKGKEPIGMAWGAKRREWAEIERTIRAVAWRGYGICLGPGRGPDGVWLVDAEGDGPSAESSWVKLCQGEVVETIGHKSRLGIHRFVVGDERFLKLLAAAGAKEDKAKPGVYHLPELPGLELRVGGVNKQGDVKQLQSVGAPCLGEDGLPRVWLEAKILATIPESACKWLESIEKPRDLTAYSRKALNDECAQFAAKPAGERHPFLLESTCRLASLVKTDGVGLTEQEVLSGLRAAAATNGLYGEGRGGEVDEAWESAKRMTDPRDIPVKDFAPRISANGDGHGETKIVEAPDDPHRLARVFIQDSCSRGDQRTLVYHRGEFHQWVESAYRSIPDHELGARITSFTRAEFERINLVAIELWKERGEADEKGKACPPPTVRKVSRDLVGNTVQALRGVTLLDGRIEAPAWLIGNPPFPPEDVLPARNALVHLPSLVDGASHAVHKPTPSYFCPYSLDYDFNRVAPSPVEFLRFLKSAWPSDQGCVDTLQEFFGYLLTPDTSHHKIGLFIGPPRSGRGTIARLISALLGPENIAGPTLSSLSTNFGLSPLIGKPVAIIGDARISGRSDWASIVERLLSISGKDALTIDRKHLPLWTGTLPTRILMLSNELPRLPDQSGALVSRDLAFRFTESFLGREDKDLDKKLAAELPGILLWAIEGWKRLRERGHFVQPESGQGLLDQARDMSSPVGAFVRERCNIAPGLKCDVADMFAEWVGWCDPKKREPGDETTFGRNLRTVIPALETKARRGDKNTGEKPYIRFFEGVAIKIDDPESSGQTSGMDAAVDRAVKRTDGKVVETDGGRVVVPGHVEPGGF